MDGTDASKGTRRRPTPPPPTASASASQKLTTAPTSRFYASRNLPPLPSRPSHTEVIQPSTPPAAYVSFERSPSRGSQLAEEAPIIDDNIPALLPADSMT
ncbi:hypothetical protein PAXINDRAFT_16690 [Paxillus involutus ATCC 200175]|uniref:Uncharacterized protein n=1 Tax=Paxillus involutus ATCC 200175 TaxID=664439 RepID=A0A0C9TSW2_PAXIN|nr:hypothetical protein PAXINDRAFT_16690 [Paxillus involutus ATCC 200175]